MDVLIVDLAGALLIAAIAWYFFGRRRKDEATAVLRQDRQEVTVTVKGGYVPEVIRVQPGVPLRLLFRREETSACSEEVVFPALGIRRHLPAFETTAIDLPPSAEGTLPFACGMDMMHGTLVVGAPAGAPSAMPAAGVEERESWPIDPVCGMRVDPARPAATLERDGTTHYFCAVSCRDRFAEGPAPQRLQIGVRRRP